jgi:hypothetical protein
VQIAAVLVGHPDVVLPGKSPRAVVGHVRIARELDRLTRRRAKRPGSKPQGPHSGGPTWFLQT